MLYVPTTSPFPSQSGLVFVLFFYLTTLTGNYPDVGWYSVSTFDFHNVTNHQLVCWNFFFLCFSEDKGLLEKIKPG